MFSLLRVNRRLIKYICKGFSSASGDANTQYSYQKLDRRCLLRVNGKEASSLLQGLITNDMRHIDEGAQSMYSLFLNPKGRIMYDTIIYKSKEDNVYLIECDINVAPDLKKHLQMYRVRRKIDIDSLENTFNVWVVYQHYDHSRFFNISKEVKDDKSASIISTLTSKLLDFENNVIVCHDPRLPLLGVRIIMPGEIDMITLMKSFPNIKNDGHYKAHRYGFGVGEGIEELPPGKCFPMEANCDYLHGVSFHKGCYIGQELTARVYHTGVIRKRLMPLFLNSTPTQSFIMDASIELDSDVKTSVGKLRGLEKTYGLGLLRINEALSASSLKVLKTTGYTMKPHWWPKEAPKERLIPGKDSLQET